MNVVERQNSKARPTRRIFPFSVLVLEDEILFVLFLVSLRVMA